MEATRQFGSISGLAVVAALNTVGCPSDPLAAARHLEHEGRLEEAAAAFVRVARSDPANLAAWDGAVRIQCETRIDVSACLNVLDLELDLLGNLHRHHDTLATSLEKRARARLEKGFVGAAAEDLERARAAAPSKASVWAALARVHLARGRLAEARGALEEARRREPRWPELEMLYRWLHAATASAAASRPEAASHRQEEGFGGAPAEAN
ncbi:MAG: tetratricopeptide repeat protein [Myxococcota bacterium]